MKGQTSDTYERKTRQGSHFKPLPDKENVVSRRIETDYFRLCSEGWLNENQLAKYPRPFCNRSLNPKLQPKAQKEV